MAKTRFSAETGIEIKRTPDNRWRHVDTNDGRQSEVGPDYHTKAELMSDHEAYLLRAGWLKPRTPTIADKLAAGLSELIDDLVTREGSLMAKQRFPEAFDALAEYEITTR